MIDKKIHIVAFDVPFPADYGGAIDVFFRIVALYNLGYKITLHCFDYGRGQQMELKKYCETVFYYKRKIYSSLLSKEPFIIASRKSPKLLENLSKNNAPILFEGLHTCAFLQHENLKKRLKIARMHNVEHNYYAALAKSNTGWRKLFFFREAKKLQQFEPVLTSANYNLAIQENDLAHFKQYSKKVALLPASIPEICMNFNSETAPFCLFHGNLSVAENENALRWILKNITFPKGMLFVVAGKNPSSIIQSVCAQLEVELVANPSDREMKDLIQSARVHLLYTEQSTGLKLKLLNSLSSSGHVLLNDKMLAGTGLKELCVVANSVEEYTHQLTVLCSKPLSKEAFDTRNNYLSSHFSTQKNCDGLFREILSLS